MYTRKTHKYFFEEKNKYKIQTENGSTLFSFFRTTSEKKIKKGFHLTERDLKIAFSFKSIHNPIDIFMYFDKP